MYEQITLSILSFFTIIGMGGAIIVYWSTRHDPIRQQLHEIQLEDRLKMFEQKSGPLTCLLKGLGRLFTPGQPSNQLQQDLSRAGYHNRNAVPIFIGTKMLLLLTGLVLFTLSVSRLNVSLPMTVFLIVAGAAFFSFMPNVIVRWRRLKRQQVISQSLPDAIDLLEICVSSGMGMNMAWNAVSDEISKVSTELADEMALTNLETHLGEPNAIAMRHMAQRTGVQEIASLTAALIQTERFGTSISEALRVYATTLREKRSQSAEEAAEKLAVKLILPMVLFIFPATLIVMAGPACLQLVDVIGKY